MGIGKRVFDLGDVVMLPGLDMARGSIINIRPDSNGENIYTLRLLDVFKSWTPSGLYLARDYEMR